MPSEGGRRGRRDNGLNAAAFVPLVDVDPRVGEHLLDVLASAGVPAFLEPSADIEPYTRALSLPSPPTDRLWVDREQRREAREIVDAETPHGTRPEPVARDDEPSRGLSDSDEERAWREIVSAWEAPAVEPVRGLRPADGAGPPDPPGPDASGTPDAPGTPGRPRPPDDPEEPEGPDHSGPGTPAGRDPADRPPIGGPAGRPAAPTGAGGPEDPRTDAPRTGGPDSRDSGGRGPRRGGRHAAGGPRGDRRRGDPDTVAGGRRGSDPTRGLRRWRRRTARGDGDVPTGADLDRAAEARGRAEEGAADDELWLDGPPSLDEGHYEPPPPPPVPRLSRQALLGVLVIVFGIFLLAAPGVVGLDDRTGLTFGVFAILGGGAVLVLRLRETRADDGPDDGAVV